MIFGLIQELFIRTRPDFTGTAFRLAGLKLLVGSKHQSGIFTLSALKCMESMKKGSQR
jgi:hypothetical protein